MSAIVEPVHCFIIGPFLSSSFFWQVNKTEKEIAHEKCSLEKELAKNKVLHILLIFHHILFPSLSLSPISAYLNEDMGHFVEYQDVGG